MPSWTPPPELLTPTPRAVRMTWLCRFLLIGNPVQLFVVVALMAGVLYRQAGTQEILKERGIAQTATITAANSCKGGVCVTYQFLAKIQPSGDVRYFEGEDTLHGVEGGTISRNIDILFDPQDPRLSAANPDDRIHQSDPYRLFRMVSVFGFGMASLMVLALGAFFGRTYSREKRLLRSGIPVAAEIVSRAEYKVKGRELTRVTYRFVDPAGNWIEGKRGGIPTSSDRNLKSAELGRKILDNPTVLYDPDDSRRNLLYPPTAVTLG